MREFKAYSTLTVKTLDEDRVIEGMATTPTPDRVNDVVMPDGMSVASLPIPLLMHHDTRLTVGRVDQLSVAENGVRFRATLPPIQSPPGLAARVEEAYQLVKHKIIRGVSIGFRSLRTAFNDNDGLDFLQWEIFELSLVPIPANAEANIDTVKALCRDFATPHGASHRKRLYGVPLIEKSGAPSPQKQRGKNAMSIATQIDNLKSTRAAKLAALNDIVEETTSKGMTKTQAQQENFDDLTAEIETIDRDLQDLETAQRLNGPKETVEVVAETQKQASDSRSGKPVQSVKLVNDEEKGVAFARYAKCLFQAGGHPMAAAQIAKQTFPNDPRIENLGKAEAYQKAAVPGAATLTPDFAGSLADPQTVIDEFLEFTRPKSLIFRFGQGNIPALRAAPFNSKVNRQTAGHTGSWRGEARPAAVSRGVFDLVSLGITTSTALTYISKENLRFSNINADMVLRDDLAGAVVNHIDTSFVDGEAAVANVRPAAINEGVAGIVSSGNDADAVRADIQALTDPFDSADLDDDGVVLLMNGSQARALRLIKNALGTAREFPDVGRQGGMLEDYPIIISNTVPAGQVIALHAPSILMAMENAVSISMSTEASIETDDAPTQDGSTGTGAAMVSLWQTGMVGFMAEHYVNWQKGRDAAVQMLTGVAWNNSNVAP